MSMVSALRRRRVSWTAVIVGGILLLWVVDGDRVDAGGIPPGQGIDLVYVAVGDNFPDALGVGPGAAAGSAPIIIVPTDPPLPGAIAAELERLDPKAVVIIGGTAAVSVEMEAAITALLPNASLDRLAGANRYETNAAITASLYPLQGWASIGAPGFVGDNGDAVAYEHKTVFNGTTGELWASIQLPHDAEVLELKVVVGDADPTYNLDAQLYRVPTDGGTPEALADTPATSGTPGLVELVDTSIVNSWSRVDNSQYSYVIRVSGARTFTAVVRQAMVRYQLGTT